MTDKSNKPVKTITYDQYLAALGLFKLTQDHYRKSEEYRRALNRHLGITNNLGELDDGYLSDAICDYPASDPSFETALKKTGIKVLSENKKKRR